MISVVIPSYNSYRTLPRTINSLLSQPKSYVSEIIVVDSSDDQKTAEYLRGCRSDLIKPIFLSKKTIPAIGRNIGARAAKSQVLAFIDSDAYAADDWAWRILKAVEEGFRAGGGSIALAPEQTKNPLALAQYFLQFNEFTPFARKKVVDFVPSCNLFCDKSLFELAGGFPEIRASEDVLFGLEISRREPFMFDPSIQVHHIFSDSRQRYFTNQRMLGEYILIYRRKYFRKWIYKGIAPLLLFPFFTAIKLYRITLRVFGTFPASLKLSFVQIFPLFLAGLFSWAGGFASACFKKDFSEMRPA